MKLPKRNKIDKNKNIEFTKKYKISLHQLKPSGFWYSCYDDWYNWIIEEDLIEFLYKYIHKININVNIMTDIRNKDKNKLLVIKNIQDLDLFNNIYGVTIKLPFHVYIDWKKVKQDFGGIEICPYLHKRRKIYAWYCSWDVASGCIWNTASIIKNTELIYQKINQKYIPI